MTTNACSKANLHKSARFILYMKMDNEEHAKLPRSLGKILFGMEDGLVTALGTVLGVSAATNDPRIVLIAGIVATFAESVSMFFGSYLSAQAKKELYERAYREEEKEFQLNHTLT